MFKFIGNNSTPRHSQPNTNLSVKTNLYITSSTPDLCPRGRVNTWSSKDTSDANKKKSIPYIDCDSSEPRTQRERASTLNSFEAELDTQPHLEIVNINVSGLRFQTYEQTLANYPNSLLGDPDQRRHFFNATTNEYFFDRHRQSFESILYIYQSKGVVRRPSSIPIDVFLNELTFFFDNELFDSFWASEGYEKPPEPPMPKRPFQRSVWKLMEYPDSSVFARGIAFISVTVIIVSVVTFCLETLPPAGDTNATDACLDTDGVAAVPAELPARDFSNPFFVIETICICWFTFEFVMRFGSCPSKINFCKSFLNIIDIVAIAPFFINQVLRGEGSSAMSFAVLRVLRLVRVFRIFKLSRHSVGLQILGKTFRASVQEFCLLIFFMCIALVLFSSGIYFAEEGKGKFKSIPASFWFAVVTMTTVGYGDMVPESTYGQVVGVMGALIGVLTLALPVPIIVSNFTHFYKQATRLAMMRNPQAAAAATRDSVSSM